MGLTQKFWELSLVKLHNSGRYRVCARGAVGGVIPIWQRRVLLIDLWRTSKEVFVYWIDVSRTNLICTILRKVEESIKGKQPKDRVAPKVASDAVVIGRL